MAPATPALTKRSEIDDKYKWNAPSVFASWDAWVEEVDALPSSFPDLAAFQGRLSEGPSVLADFMELRDSVYRRLYKVFFYALMSGNVDSNDTQATAAAGRARGLFGQFGATVAFLNPELIAIGQETLDTWINEEPRLADYRQSIHDLFRQQASVRSAEVEQVMGMLNDPFGTASDIYSELTTSDMKFPSAVGKTGKEYPVTQSTVEQHYTNPDREVRRTAYHSYRGEYLKLKNTMTAAYLTSVKQNVFKMRVRGFDSSLEASLFANNIPVEVYHNLLETFQKNLPTWHKYWDVRRRALGVDKLAPYDIWAPIVDEPQRVKYENAVAWIGEGLKPLGDEYVTALKRGALEERWVDVFPNDGKRQGAFSFGTYDTSPFIMMSYDNGLSGMSTLAHELGHSMHSYLSNKYQPFPDSNYTLFAAEVASNFNQAMTRAYLREAKKDDVQFQIALIEEAMDNFHRYFFIMPTLSRFEYEVHTRVEKGEGLTADDLIQLCYDLFNEGYGGHMDLDKGLEGMTWATFQHLYSAFYTYSYATGISAAHELAKGILAGEDGAAERYVGFLSAGGSKYPVDALNDAGVDMAKPDAVETTFGVLADMVDRLDELVG